MHSIEIILNSNDEITFDIEIILIAKFLDKLFLTQNSSKCMYVYISIKKWEEKVFKEEI
jgi:hypothetical protein